MNQVVRHFEDLEYLKLKYDPFSAILFNVTERRCLKLPLSELIMDVRFGRSIFYHLKSFHYYFALSMNRVNEQESSFSIPSSDL